MVSNDAVVRLLFAGVSFVGITTPVLAQQSSAEPGAAVAATDNSSQDIVVTARRPAESLLSVPVAITAYTADKLAKTGAIDITVSGGWFPLRASA